jgi:hypothetical protein
MVKRAAAGAVLGGSLLVTGGLGMANAAPPVDLQDGLVNVGVGNVTVAKDVNAGVATQVIAAVCGTSDGPVDVAALVSQVDQSRNPETVGTCTLPGGPVTVTQNAGIAPGNSGNAPLSRDTATPTTTPAPASAAPGVGAAEAR